MSGGRRLRVVVLDHSAQLSGAELALLRLLPSLVDAEPLVVLGEDGPLVARLRERGVAAEVLALSPRTAGLSRTAVRPSSLPLTAVRDATAHAVRLAARLRRLRPDVVHTNSNKAHLYGGLAARLAGVPQLWHARDRVVPEFMPPAAVAASRAAARVLPRAVIANSTSTLATLPGARPPQGVAAVLRDPVLAEELAGERPARSGDLVVGMLGRLAPWKGQDLFLRAFAEAFGAAPGVRARIVGSAMFGEDEYAAGLHRLCAELGIADRVEHSGFVEDVGRVLREVDVLVHASVIPEPFGQVVVEGMAAGLPVVASGEGGPAEVLRDGVTGLLFTPRDVGSLARALTAVAASPELRARLGAAARTASEDYAPGAIARQLEAVYRAVAG